MSSKIKAAIVGAGYISDYHLSAISREENVELSAICDLSRPAAEKLAQKYPSAKVFTDMKDMLEQEKPDVVHILTQPDSHTLLATWAIEAGCNVVIEKPVTTSADEARTLIAKAEEHQVKVCVNHNFVYSRPFLKLKQAIENGELGPIKSVRVVWKKLLAQVSHGPWNLWMLREPGNILFETGSHSLSELLSVVDEAPEITQVLPRDAKLLPSGKIFYRRWSISGKLGSASIQIDTSFDQGYEQHFVEVEGLFGVARADIENDVFTIDANTGRAYDAERFHVNLRAGKQRVYDAFRTYGAYAGSKFLKSWTGGPYENSMLAGIHDAYQHIQSDSGTNGTSIEFALQVAELAEAIQAKMPAIDKDALGPVPPSPTVVDEPNIEADILIIGASGFIGKRLLTKLTESGKNVRAMVRNPSSLVGIEPKQNCEVIVGDFRDEQITEKALSGIKTVIHLAVAHGNSLDAYVKLDSDPTVKFAEMCQQKGVTRFIYAGTIDSLNLAKPGAIKEVDGVDKKLKRRNNYAHSKALTEQRLTNMHKQSGFPLVIVRPAIVLGAGGPPAHVGVANWFGIGRCAYWGDGAHPLPIVLVDDIVDALSKAIETEGIEGNTYNLSSPSMVSAQEYVKEVESVLGTKITKYSSSAFSGYIGDLFKWAIKSIVGHADKKRIPSVHDWTCRQQHASFDTSAAQTDLGWSPTQDRSEIIEKGIREPTKQFLES
jgi:predicted dehydrogenase/nucleoside-diphosphate-sugar epimerase